MEAIWVVSAFLVGWLVSRVGFPPLVGYLIAGIGLSLMGQKSGHVTDELAEAGILLLLFTVGLKLRWQSLVAKEVFGVGGLHLLLVGGGVTLLLAAMGLGGKAGIVIAGGLAFSSTVLAVKLLESRSELGTFHGRLTVGVLILQDLAAMALLASLGAKTPTLWALLLLPLLFLRPVLGWILDRSGHDELMLLMGAGMAFLLAGAAQAAGVSPELGALLAGALLAGHEKATELGKTLWGIKEFFLVAFFLKMGLWGLPAAGDWFWVGLFLALLPIKAILYFALLLIFRLRARTAFVTSIGLATYSEFALIVGLAALNAGVIEPKWGSILGMTVIISLIISAPLSKNVHTLYDKLETWLEKLERPGAHRDDEPTRLGRAGWVVVGMGRTGGSAYKSLEKAGHRVVGLDADLAKVQSQLAKKRRVVYGDAEDPDLWQNLEISSLSGVLLTLPDFESKRRAVVGLRARGFKGVIGATTHHLEEDDVLISAGCNFIFHPFAAAGEKLAETALASAGSAKPESA